METRSIPTPTMAIGGTLAPGLMCRCSSRPLSTHVHVAVAEPRRRVEKHLGLLSLLRRLLAEPAIGWPLVQRRPTGDRRREPVLAGQHPRLEALLVVLPLLGVERGHKRLRMHQCDQTGHVTEPEAGDQSRLQREL